MLTIHDISSTAGYGGNAFRIQRNIIDELLQRSRAIKNVVLSVSVAFFKYICFVHLLSGSHGFMLAHQRFIFRRIFSSVFSFLFVVINHLSYTDWSVDDDLRFITLRKHTRNMRIMIIIVQSSIHNMNRSTKWKEETMSSLCVEWLLSVRKSIAIFRIS